MIALTFLYIIIHDLSNFCTSGYVLHSRAKIAKLGSAQFKVLSFLVHHHMSYLFCWNYVVGKSSLLRSLLHYADGSKSALPPKDVERFNA